MEATYAPDAAETRVPFRGEHLARAAALKADGTFVEIGAFTDVSSAVILVRAESEAAALDIVRAGPVRDQRDLGRVASTALQSSRRLAVRDVGRGIRERTRDDRVPADLEASDVRRVGERHDRCQPFRVEFATRQVRIDLTQVSPDDILGHDAVVPGRVAGEDDGVRQVQHDGDGRDAGWAARDTMARRARTVRFVASTTVRSPSRNRRSRAACRALKAAGLTAWFVASPEMASRNASDDRISSGWKWRAANVDLPDPAAPTRTTSDGVPNPEDGRAGQDAERRTS